MVKKDQTDRSKYAGQNNVQMRSGEYEEKGDYHIRLNPNWPYLPVYLAKMDYAFDFLAKSGQGKRIIDLGAGEGVLVKRCVKELSLDMFGLDLNYESKYVVHGDILDMDYPDNSFDIVTCLDVIEHMHFFQQEIALTHMLRILKPRGRLLLSVPNLAHLASRFTFFFLGKLLRTSTIDRHIGDRPGGEYLDLLRTVGFNIERVKGMFPTLPLISLLTYYAPSIAVPIHPLYNALIGLPGWSFLNVIEARKPE